ncbi:tetratricopeptide repeat protein [Lacipirellula sp.]|uniref:tetratricopeptide repeat protein n=1 Tax=Lacipirellula sp. TaxID=2691419 RepID=UPI003D0E2769
MSRFKRSFWAACTVCAVVVSQVPAFAQEAAEEPAALMRPQEAITAYEQGAKSLAEAEAAKEKEAKAAAYKAALVQFNAAIQADGTFPEAFVGKGDALKGLEDYATASNAYSQALNLDARSAAAFLGRGECFLETQQIDLAANDFNNALELAPANPKILSNIGHILVNFSRGDAAGMATAIRRLDDAIAANPEDARSYRNRGYAQALMRQFDKAEADITKAAELEPGDHENFAVLANVYLFQDNYAKAVEALTKAIDAYKPEKGGDPEIFVTGYLLRADARLKLAEKEKDAKKAEAELNEAIKDMNVVIDKFEDRAEQGQAYFRKGRAERMLERYSDAVNSFTRAISDVPAGQDVPYVADALMYRGICWYYMGEADLARGDFEQASATGSGYQDPRIFLWIGFTHHQQGNHRDAINSYGEAIAKAPNFALAHVNKGRAYMDLKEYKRAIEAFNDAIRSEPDVGDNYYNVGYAYLKMKEYKKAADFFRLALLQDDPQPKMFSKMAEALRKMGKNDLADEYQKKADEANEKQASSN